MLTQYKIPHLSLVVLLNMYIPVQTLLFRGKIPPSLIWHPFSEETRAIKKTMILSLDNLLSHNTKVNISINILLLNKNNDEYIYQLMLHCASCP